MRLVFPILLTAGLLLAGCDSSARPSQSRSLTDPSPDAGQASFNFGRTGEPIEKRLDRGVPESSSTNPRNDPSPNIPPSE